MKEYNHWKNTQIQDLPNEYWLPVKGYEGTMASNLGRVKTLKRYVRTSPKSSSFRFVDEKVKSQVKGKDGYLRVDAFQGNRCKKETAHKMCCLAFHENPLNKRTVHHKNHIKHCNEEWNLCWFTQSAQIKDAFDIGNKKTLVQNYARKGKDHYRYGKSGSIGLGKKVSQFDLDGNFIKEWNSAYQIKKELNVTGIYTCLLGPSKHAGGFKWKYKDLK